jgi:hypothetical protein
VLKEFKKAQQWLNQESEFGEAWLASAGGNSEKTRMAIRLHIEKLRDDWAKRWEFFGKTPHKVPRMLLAAQYERAMWAAHLLQALTQNWYGKPVTPENWGEGMGNWYTPPAIKVVEAAVIDRLRALNVVYQQTYSGITEQARRAASEDGTPAPEIFVDGGIHGDGSDEESKEAKAAYKWAKTFLARAPIETAGKYFPPATVRKLEPLRLDRY